MTTAGRDVTVYRITWQMPSPHADGAEQWIDADPDIIPDEAWQSMMSETTDNPWDQFWALKGWERSGREPIRAVQLHRARVVWEPVTDDELDLSTIVQPIPNPASVPAPPAPPAT